MPQAQPSRKTYKACQGCRRRRTRCDRKQPCQRCQQYSVECVHDDIRRQTKPELRQEKADLEARLSSASIVLDSLAQGKQIDFIIQLLRVGTPVEDIAKGMEGGQTAIDKLLADEPTHESLVSQKAPTPEDHAGNSHLDETFPVRSFLATIIDEETSSVSPSGAQEMPARPRRRTPTHFDSAFSNAESQNVQDTTSSPVYESMNSPSIDPRQGRPFDAARSALNTSDVGSIVDQSVFSKMSVASSHSSCASVHVAERMQQPPVYKAFPNMAIDLMTLPCKLVLDFASAFFTWKDLPFPVIRRSLFVSDYLAGRSGHCSPALIRSISCLGCRVLGSGDTSHSTYATMGNRLFDEACSLLAQGPGSTSSVPDVQAFGLLALQQLGVGQYADAIKLADEGARRMATMVGDEVKMVGDEAKMEADGFDASSPSMQVEALCSAVSLARFVRLITSYTASGQHISATPSLLGRNCFGQTDSPPEIEESLNLDALLSEQTPKEDASEGAVLICRLIDWLYRISAEPVLAEKVNLPNNLLENYRSCLAWYEKAMKQQEESLFIHLVYHFCLLALFRPFFHVLATSGMSPAGICAESCEAILSLAASTGEANCYKSPPGTAQSSERRL